MPDEGHAISAKRLSRLQREEGNVTKDEFDRINRKADKVPAESIGRRNNLGECLGWFQPAERLSRPVVELSGDDVELLLADA